MKNTDTLIKEEISIYEETSIKPIEALYRYAYVGGPDFFNQFIDELSKLAEPEVWSSKNDGINNILKNYIIKTFERCQNLNLVKESDDGEWSCFNTGLMTIYGEDIVGLFEKNRKEGQQLWYFKGFKAESDRDIQNVFTCLPSIATYNTSKEDYYFDTNKEVVLSVEHILQDNLERYPEELQALGIHVIKSLVQSSFETAKKKIKRNNRLVVPQFYNNKFSYLMPIKLPLSNQKFITMALAVEKMDSGNYRANTIFTTEMAYGKARLVMKPESNWLMENEKE